MRSVLFNGVDLQAAPFKVHDTDAFSAPVRNIITYELERTDNAVDVFRRYTSRNISLSGTVKTDTEADCDTAIDTLKLALLQAGPGQLQLEYAGGYRYWQGEAKNLQIARAAADITRAGWSCQFHVPNFYATDGNTDILLADTEVTDESYSTQISPLGTYLSRPVITLTYNFINPAVSDVGITVGNPNTNNYITITETIGFGNVITIDTLNDQVFVNGSLVPYSGQMPNWQPGQAAGFEYSDTATARTVVINVTAQRVFI